MAPCRGTSGEFYFLLYIFVYYPCHLPLSKCCKMLKSFSSYELKEIAKEIGEDKHLRAYNKRHDYISPPSNQRPKVITHISPSPAQPQARRPSHLPWTPGHFSVQGLCTCCACCLERHITSFTSSLTVASSGKPSVTQSKTVHAQPGSRPSPPSLPP